MNIELISFKICPFVQRAVITLLYKQIPHKITYIDISSPPDWFNEISPFGKVPVVRIDEEHIIFESAIIDEFLDESFPGTLLPQDPLQRAIDRSWIDFGSTLLMTFSGFIHAKNEEMYSSNLKSMNKQLAWLEKKIGDGPYFNESTFSLVDIAYAPLFMRIDLLKLSDELCPANEFPKINHWAKNLLSIPVLSQSVVSNFETLLIEHIKQAAPYAASKLIKN